MVQPKNEMYWDQDPELPDEVNECIDMMLLIFSWPPIYRTEVRRTTAGWNQGQRGDATAWCAAMHAHASGKGNAVPREPDALFDLRTRLALVHKKEAPSRHGAIPHG